MISIRLAVFDLFRSLLVHYQGLEPKAPRKGLLTLSSIRASSLEDQVIILIKSLLLEFGPWKACLGSSLDFYHESSNTFLFFNLFI